MPAGTLSLYWGDVAVVVVEQAAPGIREVLINWIGAKPPGS